jgi:CRISPR/Cas system-associated endonuclease/helicase Cas3
MLKSLDRVPVSERALIQRLGRLFRKRGERLVKHRPTGDYYVVKGDRAVGFHHNIERLGRKEGALKGYEVLVH